MRVLCILTLVLASMGGCTGDRTRRPDTLDGGGANDAEVADAAEDAAALPDASPMDAGSACPGRELAWAEFSAGAVRETSISDGPTGMVGACLEAWIRTDSDAALLGFGVGSQLLRAKCGPTVEIRNGDGAPTLITGVACDDGEWHHLALCAAVDTSGFNMMDASLFLDGREVGNSRRDNASEPTALVRNVLVSGDRVLGPGAGFDGDVDNVRLSRGRRYATNFTPDRDIADDVDTVAFFPLDADLASSDGRFVLSGTAGSVRFRRACP